MTDMCLSFKETSTLNAVVAVAVFTPSRSKYPHFPTHIPCVVFLILGVPIVGVVGRWAYVDPQTL